MTFGERLYQLRKAKNLSQEDLAERLEVSRQSVSRWENGSATPDFEKTVRLSELFETTTDYLLKGTMSLPTPNAESKNPPIEFSLPTWRKVLSAVFLVLSGIATLIGLFFGGWWDYYLYVPLPLAIMGLLLLFNKKRTLLRVVWTFYLFTATLLHTSLGLSWNYFFLLFRPHPAAFNHYIPSGVVLFLLMLAVVIYTAFFFRKQPVKNKKMHLIALCLMPLAYLFQEYLSGTLLLDLLLQLVLEQGSLYMAINLLLSLVRLAIITAFAILLAQTIYRRKKK
ncbi:MAG: helix-turn-helix domain-containing protein [Clostridia bacterium]|nr:helix-turn-helix domain-containing protein [Clostridia bacterium]